MRCTNCEAELTPADDVCGQCGAPRPQLALPFADAKPRFAALGARFESGELDDAAYEAELQELLVEDDTGDYWMFSSDEGEWYWHDGEEWVRRDPPLAPGPEKRPQEKPTAPLAPRFAEAEPQFAALSARYAAGELDDAAYEAAFQELLVEDDTGDYWMFSTDDGEWYWHDGQEWAQRDPPPATDAEESAQVQPTFPEAEDLSADQPTVLAPVKPAPVKAASARAVKPPPAKSARPVTSVPPLSATPPPLETVICPSCGTPTRRGSRFCTSCGGGLMKAVPETRPAPAVARESVEPIPAGKPSVFLLLLTPIGWLIAWALSGGIGTMLSPWPSPVLTIVISLATAGAIAGSITGLMLQRTGLPLTRKESFAVAVRFAISWTIGWILGWGVLALFYGAISGLSARVGFGVDAGIVQTVILSWAGIWGVTGTIAGIAAGAIVTVSLGRLLRRTGQSIEGKRVLTVAVGYPLGWVLGWATGGALGAAIGAAVAGGTGAEAGGAIGGAIAGAICSGVLLRRLR